MSWVCMRCGFINEDDSSFICERCNNNQPFQYEIDTKSKEDKEIPAPPGEGSEDEGWGGDEETEDDDGEEEWDDEEEGEEEEEGEYAMKEWDDAPPEPEDEEEIESPPLDICPKCTRKTKEHWTNCAYCGTKLKDDCRRKCPSCGKPLKKGWTLCAYCGKKC